MPMCIFVENSVVYFLHLCDPRNSCCLVASNWPVFDRLIISGRVLASESDETMLPPSLCLAVVLYFLLVLIIMATDVVQRNKSLKIVSD